MLHDDRNRDEVRQLEDDFFDWFETADAEELEDGTLDGFLEELERMDPLPGGFDPQKSLADFHEKYAALLNPQKVETRKSRISRRAFFAVAAVVAVLASMVTAQAFGVDIFGFFGRWTDERFTFTGSEGEAGYQKRFYPMEEGQTTTYSSLRDALDDFQLDLPLFPFWIPERFPEQEAVGTVTPDGLRIRTSFFAEEEGGQEALTVEYSESGEEGLADVMEKASLIYEAGEISHYVTTEQDHCTAVWIQDDLQCEISGDITEEEMKDILDSLYYYYPTYEEDVQSRKEERHYPVENCAEMEFGSLLEALYTFRVHTNLAPSWFPEDIGKFDVSGKITPRGMEVYALSRAEVGSGQRTVTIVYTEFGEDGPGLIIEKDENPPIAYEKMSVTHYITTDHGFCTAAWVRENIEAMIFGPVTVEEMKQIIDSIYSDGEKEAEFPPPSSFDSSLKAALDECGISGEFVPTWCPEGFQASEPEISSTSRTDYVYMEFQGAEERFFRIDVTRYHSSKDVEAFVFEKDKSPVEQYTSGAKTVYILSNNKMITAAWSDGLIVEMIAGNLTVEEVKKIIDSIDS